jgi:hypothetical protein
MKGYVTENQVFFLHLRPGLGEIHQRVHREHVISSNPLQFDQMERLADQRRRRQRLGSEGRWRRLARRLIAVQTLASGVFYRYYFVLSHVDHVQYSKLV